MAFFPTDTGGFFDGMNIFGAKQPDYLGGLLDPAAQEKLKNQALISGILGAGATYLAQPKNQGYGSALPYLAKSYLGGMTQSQNAYDQGTQNLITQARLSELKQKLEQDKLQKEYIDKFAVEHPEQGAFARAFPGSADVIGKSLFPNKPEIKPLELDQLIATRDKLMADNPKDPRIDIYNKKIKKETEYAPTAATSPVDMGTVENTAQLIANNQIMPLTGQSLRTPWGQNVMSRVREINPQYTIADIGGIKKSVSDFTTGKAGNTIRSLNVTVDHLDTLNELSTALNNNDIKQVNRLGNAFAAQTGGTAPTNFNAAKKVVADEIVKGIVGSGGGVTDREEAAAAIDAANSPAQLQGVIQTYQKLLTGQLGGFSQQYVSTTGKTDFDKYLSPRTKKILGGNLYQQNAPAPSNTGWSIEKVK